VISLCLEIMVRAILFLRKQRVWDKAKQDKFHDRMELYEARKGDNDFIQTNFDPAEIAKIRKFVAHESVLKQHCDELGFPYEPPSKSKWDYQRRQRLHCRWSYNTRKPTD